MMKWLHTNSAIGVSVFVVLFVGGFAIMLRGAESSDPVLAKVKMASGLVLVEVSIAYLWWL